MAYHKQPVEIVQRKNRLVVRIPTRSGRWIYADRDARGRIIYDNPAMVGREAKYLVVAAFKEIDRRVFSNTTSEPTAHQT